MEENKHQYTVPYDFNRPLLYYLLIFLYCVTQAQPGFSRGRFWVEIGRRITDVTEDSKETIYLYQRISINIQRGNAISFLHTFDIDDETDI